MMNQFTKEEVIKKLRIDIDRVDRELISLLAKRFRWTKKVGIYKAKYSLPATDPIREQEVFKDRRLWAKKFGVDGDFVVEVFNLIIKSVKRNHKLIANTKK